MSEAPTQLPLTGASADLVNARREQMFPQLSDKQLARIAHLGTERSYAAGEIVVDQGESNVPFLVVLEGRIEVVLPDRGVETRITVHGERQFTGEADQLTGRRALVRCRALEPTRVLALERKALLGLVQTDGELSELIMRAFILRRVGLVAGQQGDAVVIGSRFSAATLRVQEFLGRNGHPFRYVDAERDPAVQEMFDAFHVGIGDVPVLICRGDRVLKNPSNSEIADCLGFNASVDVGTLRDVVVVGAGPAGLAAAVYAASEGLDVLVLETTAPGGQAGSSSKIENYLGFPTGISGQALASRALAQAEKFGAVIAVARSAVRLRCDALPYRVELSNGESVATRAIVIATGAEYTRLKVPELARFEGVGVYYGATFVEAQRCQSDEVLVIGGGNSAGQAATYLSGTARHVHMLIRGDGLAASMSRYLSRRIEETPNITLHTGCNIVALDGGESLEQVAWVDRAGLRTTRPIRHVFSMTGAKPNTEWLKGCLELDDRGFVRTGTDVLHADPSRFAGGRAPHLLETSVPRVFAVGDVRATSIKRVASAVGEGSACIQLVHRVLAE